jgi:hypothetical protein
MQQQYFPQEQMMTMSHQSGFGKPPMPIQRSASGNEAEADFDRKESSETLKPMMQGTQDVPTKSFRAKDVVAFNDDEKFKLQEIEKAIDCLLAN